MADLSALLAVLEHDPDDAQALEALEAAARVVAPEARAHRFAAAKKLLEKETLEQSDIDALIREMPKEGLRAV